MASSVPVVVTAVGGNPDIVREGREGLLVPRGDSAAAAAAIGRLLDDPDLSARMGRAGHNGEINTVRTNRNAVHAYSSGLQPALPASTPVLDGRTSRAVRGIPRILALPL